MSHNHNIILLRNVVIDAYEYVGQFGNAIERNNWEVYKAFVAFVSLLEPKLTHEELPGCYCLRYSW